MNIFHLDDDPAACARLHCDKHVGKMLVETAQMLSTALVLSGGEARWKPAFANHPMNRWVRESAGNFRWSHDLGRGLAAEYRHRFDKAHGAEGPLLAMDRDGLARLIGDGPRTKPPLCMGDLCKVSGDPVEAYRYFYAAEKARFARWTRRPVPGFMQDAFIPMSAEEVEAAARWEG
jgi:hypothetical protein